MRFPNTSILPLVVNDTKSHDERRASLSLFVGQQIFVQSRSESKQWLV